MFRIPKEYVRFRSIFGCDFHNRTSRLETDQPKPARQPVHRSASQPDGHSAKPIQKFGGQAFPHFQKMMDCKSAVCVHSIHEPASSDRRGGAPIASAHLQICNCRLISGNCIFVEKAEVQFSDFCEHRSVISLSENIDLELFDVLYKLTALIDFFE